MRSKRRVPRPGCRLVALVLLAGCREGMEVADADTDTVDGAPPDAGVYACSDNGACSQPLCDQVPLPPGEFVMGSTYSGEAHTVFLDAFCIDRYEVTIERHRACVAEGACDSRPYGPLPPECPPADPGLCPTHPVFGIGFEQTRKYCEWLGRRLCTEAEWERAASGPGPGKLTWPWGETPPDESRVNGGPYLAPVDAYPLGASAEGVLGLIGNVYEWVSDWYGPYEIPEDGVVVNPTGPVDGTLRIVRGGCIYENEGATSSERIPVQPEGFT